MVHFKIVLAGLVMAAAAYAGAAPASARPTFSLSFISGTTQAAQDDFTAAANYWAGRLTNNVTINLTVGTANLGSSILGETTSAAVFETYSSLRTDLIAGKSSSAADTMATANLPSSASPLSIYMNHTTDNGNSATPFVYSIGAPDFHMTTANARALGYSGLDALGYSTAGQSLSVASGTSCASCDAIIEFTTAFNWDTNPADGITAGYYDFTGAAVHEIAHALGFISGVDIVDYFASGTPTQAAVLAGYYMSPLDLFRCSTASKAAGTALDFTEDTRTKYFSLNDCTTTGAAQFADGFSGTNGDGSQASHWKNGLGLGIMNPTLASGVVATVSGNDLTALDAIGWNLNTPEPASIALGGVWLAALGFARRRRARM
jgi:hypothetical protein